MMREYITNKGYALLSKMLSGECTITFTKIKMGNGIPAESDLRKMTDMSRTVCAIDVESVKIEADNTVDITATFTNTEIETAFYFKEKGVLATDGTTEILFSYSYTEDAELIPTYSEEFMEKRLKTVVTQLQDTTSEINIAMRSGIYVATEEYEDDIAILSDTSIIEEAFNETFTKLS